MLSPRCQARGPRRQLGRSAGSQPWPQYGRGPLDGARARPPPRPQRGVPSRGGPPPGLRARLALPLCRVGTESNRPGQSLGGARCSASWPNVAVRAGVARRAAVFHPDCYPSCSATPCYSRPLYALVQCYRHSRAAAAAATLYLFAFTLSYFIKLFEPDSHFNQASCIFGNLRRMLETYGCCYRCWITCRSPHRDWQRSSS